MGVPGFGGSATEVNLAEAREACALFLDEPADACVITPTKGGVNNVVQYVDTPSGRRFVLRIYNNGLNHAKARARRRTTLSRCPVCVAHRPHPRTPRRWRTSTRC